MKRTSLLFAFCILIPFSCDFGDHPLTDPNEIYEKADALIQERSFKQAKPLLEEAVGLFKKIKNNDRLTQSLISLVQTEMELGEFKTALAVSEEAATLMRMEGDVHGEIRMAFYFGTLYTKIQMFDRAAAWYRKALASATAFGDKKAFSEARLKLAFT